MKKLTIASTLVTLSLGAFVSACGGAEATSTAGNTVASNSDVTAPQEFASSNDALTACDDVQYDHWRYISALAVAAANELGRWNISDFTNSGGQVALSSSGLARCASGCANVQAILQLQNSATSVIPRHDPNLLKQYLVNFYTDQVNWNVANGFKDYSLVPSGVSTGGCGYRYSFKVVTSSTTTTTTSAPVTTLKVMATGKCVDFPSNTEGAHVFQITCDGTQDQNFTLEAQSSGGYHLKNVTSGKCLRAADSNVGSALELRTCDTTTNQSFDLVDYGGKYGIKSRMSNLCVEVPYPNYGDYSEMKQTTCVSAYNNQQFAMTTTTSTSSSSSSSTAIQPYQLKDYLRWVGPDVNPYIQFQSTSTDVSLDPMGTLVDGGSTGQSGSCVQASTVYDATRTSAGKCCEYNGVYGTLVASAWNPSMFYCK